MLFSVIEVQVNGFDLAPCSTWSRVTIQRQLQQQVELKVKVKVKVEVEVEVLCFVRVFSWKNVAHIIFNFELVTDRMLAIAVQCLLIVLPAGAGAGVKVHSSEAAAAAAVAATNNFQGN